MNADKINSISETIIGAIFEVSNKLGPSFLEKVYERALLHELTLRGLQSKTQVNYSVIYKGKQVGDYYADLVVEKQSS